VRLKFFQQGLPENIQHTGPDHQPSGTMFHIRIGERICVKPECRFTLFRYPVRFLLAVLIILPFFNKSNIPEIYHE
jgi:hypothetical protein